QPAAPIKMQPTAFQPSAPAQPVQPMQPGRSSISSTPTPPAAGAAGGHSISASPALRSLGASLAPNSPAPSPAMPQMQPQEPVAAVRQVDDPSLVSVPFLSMTETWPEAMRQEIARMNLANARLAMPPETIEDALKRGRVAFPWKVIRSWIRPAVPAAA